MSLSQKFVEEFQQRIGRNLKEREGGVLAELFDKYNADLIKEKEEAELQVHYFEHGSP